MRCSSKILHHKCCRTWQVYVMGPVIGDVNAGASIVKAMLVTDASMHFSAPLLRGRISPSCRDGDKSGVNFCGAAFHCRAC